VDRYFVTVFTLKFSAFFTKIGAKREILPNHAAERGKHSDGTYDHNSKH